MKKILLVIFMFILLQAVGLSIIKYTRLPFQKKEVYSICIDCNNKEDYEFINSVVWKK
jgi:hypothetical protein